jgi:hypothetical protein
MPIKMLVNSEKKYSTLPACNVNAKQITQKGR